MKCMIKWPIDWSHVDRQWWKMCLSNQCLTKLKRKDLENLLLILETSITCMGKLSDGNLMQYRQSFWRRSSRKMTISCVQYCKRTGFVARWRCRIRFLRISWIDDGSGALGKDWSHTREREFERNNQPWIDFRCMSILWTRNENKMSTFTNIRIFRY